MACAPQRFLANNRNIIREAVLTPSAVRPIADQVQSIKQPRQGTAQVALTGEFIGAEEALYDVEITDTIATVARTSQPIFSGAGSGDLVNIIASVAAQEFVVELHDVGLPTTFAHADFEGVTISARASGPGGNDIHINIDQADLIFTDSTFSLLEDLKAGQGSPTSGIEGPAFDWDAAVVGDDDIIPDTANRVSFGSDTSQIYLQYKKYVDGVWLAYFVPALKRDVSAGTLVRFVTGGRTVTVTDGVTPETYNGVVTLYDFLNDLKTASALVTVDGVVANDRTPTGQAAQELRTRTDAYVQPSTGSGSAAARGFEDTFANANAATELVIARCFAVTSTDHPLARLGAERWILTGSVSGDLGEIVTGIPFTDPDGKFGLTIPQRLPDGYGVQRGRFSIVSITYQPRAEGVDPPPICPVALTLGTEAVDQTIEFVWTKRPSGACLCADMPIPVLNPGCLGLFSTEGGTDMEYLDDAILRLKDLYDWADELATAVTQYKSGFAFDGVPELKATPSSAAGGSGTLSGESSTVSTTRSGPNTTLTRTVTISPVSEPVGAEEVDALLDKAPVTTGYADVALPADFQACINFYETGIAEINKVTDTGLRADGFSAWDDALQKFKDDLDISALGYLGDRLATIATVKYALLVRKAMAYAGIPQLGKADASILTSGDGCWHDLGGDFWAVTGSARGAYAPAFNNEPYYSSRLSADGLTYFSTKEFGLQINVKCPSGLEYGDTIVLSIGDAGWGATYQVGDLLTLPIISARDLYLVGGQDGNDLLTWYVTGSVDGPFPPFIFDRTAPAPYFSTAGLEFELIERGIPFEQGDAFRFSVEGGHFRWRKDGGAWSAPVDIPAAPQVFDAGLLIDFESGNSPSFVTGDVFSFRALQPWAVSNIQSPLPTRWEWGDDTASAIATLVSDSGTVQTVEAIGLGFHTLPVGTTITIEAGTVAGLYPFIENVPWRPGAIFHELSTPQNARYLRLTINDAEGAGIGWFWAGEPLTQTRQIEGQLKRVYRVQRPDAGLFQGGRYSAMAVSGVMEWSEGALTEADVVELKAFMDWVKSNDDEPFIFVPQNTRPDEAFLERLAQDEVEITDVFKYGHKVQHDRAFSVNLPLSGVWQ